MTDFTYTTKGLSYDFWPESAAAHAVMGEIMEQNGGTNAVFLFHWDAFLQALTKAGYTIRKARKSPDIDDDALLAALG
jgi:hypothetical protein